MIIVALTILCGILYHLGGLGDDGKKLHSWLPAWIFNPKMRDWGCAVCAIATICWRIGTADTWMILASFGLHWAALSAYWKKKGDMQAKHWFAHGLGIGLAAMPFAWCGAAWWILLIRAVTLGVAMMWISVRTSRVAVEEMGRGALIIATVVIV